MSNELTTMSEQALEKVLIEGDLSLLTPRERLFYYKQVCQSIGLNPLTKPFEYIRLSGKLTFYARKECTEQLRRLNKVSIVKLEGTQTDSGAYIVTAYAKTASGMEDISTGAVCISNLKGELLANAYMKAETKAKRRVTLSICGLGLLDESEVDSIKGAVIESNIYENDLKQTQTEPLIIEDVTQHEIRFNMLMGVIKSTQTTEELANVYQDIKDDPIKQHKQFYKPLIDAVKIHKEVLTEAFNKEVIESDINM